MRLSVRGGGIQPCQTLEVPRLKIKLQELSDLIDKREADAIEKIAVIKALWGPTINDTVFASKPTMAWMYISSSSITKILTFRFSKRILLL